MFSPRYVWLMTEGFIPAATYHCSAANVGCAMRHQFFFQLNNSTNVNLPTISNHTV